MPFLEPRKLKSGKTSWRIVWHDPPTVRHRLKVGVTTRRVAELQLTRVEALLASGKDPLLELAKSRRRSVTLSKLLELDNLWAEHRLRPKTLEANRHAVRSFSVFAGDIEVGSVTTDLIERYVRSLFDRPRPATATTINIYLRTLKSLFQRGIDVHQVLASNSFKSVKPISNPNAGRVTFLTGPQIVALMDAIRDDGAFVQLVKFYLLTGARRNEATNLVWGDVDVEMGLLWLGEASSRTKRRRSVPLGTKLRELLTELWVDAPDHFRQTRVFWRLNFTDTRAITRRFSRLRDRVPELPADFTPHVLRHTFASHLVMSGVDLTTIASILGHSTTATTMLYAHLTQDHRTSAINRIPYLG